MLTTLLRFIKIILTQLIEIIKIQLFHYRSALLYKIRTSYRIVQKVRGTKLSRFSLEPQMFSHEFQNV